MTDNDSLFRGIFLNNIPLLDTRSPGEFAKGSFPKALNLPLMLDEERAKVGTTYKQQGQDAAIALGHKLVSGEVKEQRVKAWYDFAQQHPQGYLFCWRGGLRSQISQIWLREAGVEYPRIPGGYKALRRFLIEQSEDIINRIPLVLLAGKTGSGKTQVLNTLPHSLDLEGLANHRGSSFGRRPAGQPTQLLFENKLAIDLLKLAEHSPHSIILEDEGGFIGSCSLPLSLYKKMRQSPRVLLEVPLEDRVETILNDYIVNLSQEYMHILGDGGWIKFTEMLRGGIQRLKQRLGGQACKEIGLLLEGALKQQLEHGDVAAHRLWIRELLIKYYDPSYDYQLSRHQQAAIFKGNKQDVSQWLAQHVNLAS
jgi:tRNA 2-selenouridine synthase